MSTRATLEEPRPRTGRSWAAAVLSECLDLPLVIYGLTIGVLAIGAGALVARADQSLGPLTKASSLLVTGVVALAASIFGNSLLKWLLPSSRRPSRRHP